MKKFFKIVLITFIVITVLSIGGCLFLNKKVPKGVVSDRTAELIDEMNAVIDKKAWDSTRYVKWSFTGEHHYVWDKEANLAQITWKDNKILLNPDQVTGVAYAQNQKLEGAQAEKLVKRAWSFWCNDMFWLTAPFKVNDPGVTHELVEDEKGERLKVIYSSGGVTPGDVYVWEFDKEGKPKAFEMYVKIIPIKGIEVPWTGWKKLSTGAMLSTSHEFSGMSLLMEDVKGGMSLSDVDLEEDVWAEIR